MLVFLPFITLIYSVEQCAVARVTRRVKTIVWGGIFGVRCAAACKMRTFIALAVIVAIEQFLEFLDAQLPVVLAIMKHLQTV